MVCVCVCVCVFTMSLISSNHIWMWHINRQCCISVCTNVKCQNIISCCLCPVRLHPSWKGEWQRDKARKGSLYIPDYMMSFWCDVWRTVQLNAWLLIKRTARQTVPGMLVVLSPAPSLIIPHKPTNTVESWVSIQRDFSITQYHAAILH